MRRGRVWGQSVVWPVGKVQDSGDILPRVQTVQTQTEKYTRSRRERVLPRLAEFTDATSIDGPRLFSIFTMCAVLSRCTENVSVAAALRRYVEWSIFCTDHGLATVTFEPALLFSCTFEFDFRHGQTCGVSFTRWLLFLSLPLTCSDR